MEEVFVCSNCGKEIPKERLECYTTCIDCTNTKPHVVLPIYNHKTAPDLVIINGNNKESIRQAYRANRRAR